MYMSGGYDIEKIASVVGSENIFKEDGDISPYRKGGPVSGGDPVAVVKPPDNRSVRNLIKLARKEGMNLVFRSSTTPSIHGASVPRGKAIIVDMSEMGRLLRLDRRNKVALIEPGVTFEKLIPEAEKAGLKVLMPLLPRKGKSVLASCLEREPIIIPKYHWDMTDPLLCTEIIFGTGDIFRTGSAAGPGSLEMQWASGLAQKNPMGPAQTDFVRIVQGSQGTMAAVTWCSLKLEVKPSAHRIYFCAERNIELLIDLTYRALRQRLGDEWFVLNSQALATVVSKDGDNIHDIADAQAPYTLVFGISGYEYLPEERISYQEKDISNHAQAAGVALRSEIPGCSWRRMERIISGVSELPYYKTRVEGAFYDIFFLTTLNRVPRFLSIMNEQAEKHGYPAERIGVYIQPIQQGRNAHVEFTLYYKPEDEPHIIDLFDSASKALAKEGAFFSRPYGIWADIAYERCADTVRALRLVKNILDPDHILNRDRLCFSREVV